MPRPAPPLSSSENQTRAEGGSDDPSNLITLCSTCHDKLHERQTDGSYNHAQRVIAGQQAAKAAGVKFGRKRKLSDYQRAEAVKRRAAGETLASITTPYRKELKRADLTGTNMEVITSINEIKPGEVSALHIHHGEESFYVVEGGMVELKDGKQAPVR